ncbi:MAG: hypothetical protein ACOX6L_10340 [Syntrophomonadaceae bacterium]|jgi:polyhydroxyalkanoic acid synthase PhaR subunit
MSEDSKKETAEQVSVPDFSELWKNLYFNNEAIWAEAFKDYLSTKSFVNMMDTSLDKHLTLEKLTRQNLEKFFETTPVPSKQDVARVGELVISLEEKIDTIEFQLLNNFQSMADSLIKMADYQEDIKKQLAAMGKELKTMGSRLDKLEKNQLSEPTKAPARKKTTKKDTPAE